MTFNFRHWRMTKDSKKGLKYSFEDKINGNITFHYIERHLKSVITLKNKLKT